MPAPAPDKHALDRPTLEWSARPARAEAAVVVTADANAFPFAAFLAARLAGLEPAAPHDLLVLLTDGSRPDPTSRIAHFSRVSRVRSCRDDSRAVDSTADAASCAPDLAPCALDLEFNFSLPESNRRLTARVVDL